MKFPDIPTFRGFQAPGRFEADIRDIPVIQGAVPEDLNGGYYRAGPDPFYPPLSGKDIPLNGDGMVTRFRFDAGRVDFKCRYVRTPKFVAERAAGRALFGAYRNPFTDDPSVCGVSRGTANTNIVWHSGRMFALKEDSHPVEIDPITLDTLGSWDYSGSLTSLTATAHPKVDPTSGTLVFFGYAARGETTPDIAYYEADVTGAIIHESWLRAPYSGMVHDFAVTANHIVFPVVPLISDLQRLKDGFPHFAWDPSLPMYLGVLPRRDPNAQVRWFQGSARFASHTMNAFEENGRIHIDMSVGDSVAFPFFPEINGNPFDAEAATPYVSRWTLDLNAPTDDFRLTRLSDIPGEFPRIDERFAMTDYRYGYVSMQSLTAGSKLPGSFTGMRFNLIGRVDHRTGETAYHDVGDSSVTQEAVFVPRTGSVSEGDGYLMALVNRYDEMRSDLLILDAADIAGEPIATLALPLRLRNGLHGTWVDADQLRAYEPPRDPIVFADEARTW
jgi:carotenoid cleavage dioxygenase-like enzyme